MSKIRSKNTQPELYIRSELYKRGFRFRVDFKLIEGRPDIYITKKRIAIFIHGCYWHRHHNCKFSYVPKTNVDFWLKKFSSNVKRDKTVMETLKKEGIRLILIWECTVKRMIVDDVFKEEIIAKLQTFINSNEPQDIEF